MPLYCSIAEIHLQEGKGVRDGAGDADAPGGGPESWT
jgi:hypothetical protein